AAAGEEATALNEDAAEALGRDAPSDGETEEAGDDVLEAEEEKPGLMDRLNAFLGRDKEEEPVLASGRKLLEQLKPEQLSATLLADAGIDADNFLLWMGREFKIPAAYTDAERRSVAGVQYELIMRRLGDNSVYVLTHNVDTEFLSLLADGGYSGYKLINSSVRQYATDAAAHILGTVGKLVKEDLEDPKYDGYPLDAVVGRSGVEAAFEEYLHGIDGRRVLSVSEDGVITGEYYSKEPQPGSTVELTIDLDFQEAVEAALKETVVSMTEADHQVRGAGAAVVRVGTGEILALASYPTFTLNDYRTRYTELAQDPTAPLLNRATSGLYPPGSTLKPATAVCALMNGKTTLTTRLYDTGRWNYPGSRLYTNCWYLPGHGTEYLSKAITDSCNYYFAEMGFRLGMDALRQTYSEFGLGAHTGIETGDSAGQLPYNPQGQDQAPWAAYGQSNQLYTPLQLANYIATLSSGGKHCKAHLLKAVKSYDGSQVLAVGDTAPTNIVEIKDEYLEAIREGMHNLAHGQLWRQFSQCAVDVAAKTGTAQLGKGITNNAIFVCFAPYEEPEIAIGMVIEKGDTGSKLTSTAVEILNAYFVDDSAFAVTGENALLP
ncbi:MAG: penicillin-binding protein A, partial [Oscillibacter sp.]|nr:penicillin-binding protein A [Oscillibacter sp.]